MSRFAAWVAVWLGVVGPLGASAQDTGAPLDDVELDDAARVLFRDGTTAYAEGRFEVALDRYETAYELSERPALLYNIALAHDRLDHKRESADYYERFAVSMPESERAALARSRAAILRQTLLDDVEGVEAAEGPPDSVPGPSRVGPLVSFAVAAAGLATFGVAGSIARAGFSDCEDTPCSDAEIDAIDTQALVADIGLGVALAGAVVGTVWWIVGSRSGPDDNRARFDVTPSVGLTHALLSATGSF